MDFDAKAAAEAGYSPQEISRIQQGIESARSAGYSDEEIFSHLSGAPQAPTEVRAGPGPVAPDIWGPTEAVESGTLLGAGPYVRALGETLRTHPFFGVIPGTVEDYAKREPKSPALFNVGELQTQNLPFGLNYLFAPPKPNVAPMPTEPSFGEAYAKNLAEAQAARTQYMAGSPTAGPALEALGATPAVLAANALTPGVPLPGLLGRVGTGVVQGAESALMQHGMSGEPIGSDLATGAVVGGALPVLGRLIPNPLRPAINPEVAQMAREAGALGVPLRPGQLAMSNVLRGLDKRAAAPGGDTEQVAAFTKALSHTFGEEAEALTPGVLSKARDRIGSTLDDVALHTTIVPDNQLAQNLVQIEHSAAGLEDSERGPVVRMIESLRNRAASGQITGEEYQNLTKRGSPLSMLAQSQSGNVRYLGVRLRDALDGALERSAPPEQVDRLLNARAEWKNLMVLQPLAEKAPSGIVNPRLLGAAVRKGFSDFGWTEPSAIGTLAHAGQFLPSTEVQGVAKTGHMVPWWAKAGAGLGEALLASHSPRDAAIAAAAGAGLYGMGKLTGAALRSTPYRAVALASPLGVNPLLPMATRLAPPVYSPSPLGVLAGVQGR